VACPTSLPVSSNRMSITKLAPDILGNSDWLVGRHSVLSRLLATVQSHLSSQSSANSMSIGINVTP
jgi:hypothetical protein